MKKTTKLIATLMAILTLVTLVPCTVSASNEPYCMISFDASLGCNTVKYYSYSSNTFRQDTARLVKFYDGKILLGTNDTLLTSSHKAGTNPAWTPNGNYLSWFDNNNSFCLRNYKTGEMRYFSEVSNIKLNAESMVSSVILADGSVKSVTELLSDSTSNVTPPSPTSPSSPSSPSTKNPIKNPAVQQWTDSAGREHYKFGKNKVIVDGHDVYLNDYKISELCNSSVRFVAIDSSNRVYLYEDKTASLYRFKVVNIFKPSRIKFAKGTKLQRIELNSNGYLTKIVTTSGTFTVKQLAVDKTWYPKKNYAINKKGYCTYYLAETSKTYTLRLKGTKLYLNKKVIAKGITRKTESFGFKGKFLYYVKAGKRYEAKISSPKMAKVTKTGIKKLTYSKKDGCVKGAK